MLKSCHEESSTENKGFHKIQKKKKKKKLKIKVVNGGSLGAAIMLNNIPKRTTQVLLRCKITLQLQLIFAN